MSMEMKTVLNELCSIGNDGKSGSIDVETPRTGIMVIGSASSSGTPNPPASTSFATIDLETESRTSFEELLSINLLQDEQNRQRAWNMAVARFIDGSQMFDAAWDLVRSLTEKPSGMTGTVEETWKSHAETEQKCRKAIRNIGGVVLGTGQPTPSAEHLAFFQQVLYMTNRRLEDATQFYGQIRREEREQERQKAAKKEEKKK